MDEDSFHKAVRHTDRWILSFDTSAENVQTLWDARGDLEKLLREHWSAIELDEAPGIMQVTQKSAASGKQLAAMFQDALKCGVYVLYADTRVFMLLDHSVVSGHLGCRLTTWVSQQEWADHIGMPAPGFLTEVLAMAVGTWRIWSIPIIRSFWSGESPTKVIAAPPKESTAPAPSKYACHFSVELGTHPQAIMHQVLTRVAAGWNTGTGEPVSWTMCSAAPFKEIRDVANNVGVMSYTFPVEPPCSPLDFRAQLGYAKWQVVLSAAANRAFAGKGGSSITGAIVSRLIPDVAVGRNMVDAIFSFMVMPLGKTDAVHLYSSNGVFSGPSISNYGRQKAFIAAAYDKTAGRVHITLQVNLNAVQQPDEAKLRSAGFEPFEQFGPFDRARLSRN